MALAGMAVVSFALTVFAATTAAATTGISAEGWVAIIGAVGLQLAALLLAWRNGSIGKATHSAVNSALDKWKAEQLAAAEESNKRTRESALAEGKASEKEAVAVRDAASAEAYAKGRAAAVPPAVPAAPQEAVPEAPAKRSHHKKEPG